MAHSPAPWRWSQNEHDYPNLPILFDSDDKAVMDFGDDTEYYPTQGDPPSPSDAALIAAAPELLEALKMVRETLNMICDTDGAILQSAVGKKPHNLREFIQSAIAKAEPK